MTTEKKQFLVTHPTGNENVRALLQSLEKAQLLATYGTTLAFGVESISTKWPPKKISREIKRRAYPPNIVARSIRYPWRETGRLLATRIRGLRGLARHEVGPLSIDAVCRHLDKKIARALPSLLTKKGLTDVYCYEDAARATFEAAGALGLRRNYDLPIGYWRAGHRIFHEEREREPEWASTLTGLRDSDEKLRRKDEELALSDSVLVASGFTRGTLQEYPGLLPRVTVVPYGFPEVQVVPQNWNPEGPTGKPLRVLFVGGLSQRKGLSYLLEGCSKAGGACELTLIGRRIAECAPLDRALQSLRWIESLPHPEILKMMRQHDVLVFPSLFEGFGLVLTEAMACGMAVVTTAHTAGPDLITSGKDGLIISIRDADAIAKALVEFQEDRSMLARVRLNALKTAETRPWSQYGTHAINSIAA